MHSPVVALLGKLGHGKTSLLNKLTGKHFPSHAGARSCTRTLQNAPSLRLGIQIVDTPGFYASEDIAAHIAAQKLALEAVEVSGVYIVVRYSRADEIAEMLTKVMDFVGSDDLRIIMTHGDVASKEVGYDPEGMKDALNELLGIPQEFISVVGRDTDGESIESFINATLHEPRRYQIGDAQVGMIASLCMGARKINKPIEEIMAKIQAATNACHELVENRKDYDTDLAISAIQSTTTDAVNESKISIFEIAEGLKEEQQNLIYGKAGLSLSIRLQQFMESTNKCLSWDVTDPSDQRNQYKSCPHCGAVFVKVEGCDHIICGAVPQDYRRPKPAFNAQFKAHEQKGWVVQFFVNGSEVLLEMVPSCLANFTRNVVTWGGGRDHRKVEGSVFESGCGASLNWGQMQPIPPERLKELGSVELQQPGHGESNAKRSFEDKMNQARLTNLQILSQGLAQDV